MAGVPRLWQKSRMNDVPQRKALPRLDESLLTHLSPFSRLERPQIRAILDAAVSRRYEKGATVFMQDTSAERFHLLMDGYIRVSRLTPTGDQVTVLHIPPGELFGIAQALGHTRYPASATAVAESIALSWPMHLWQAFADEYPGFATENYRYVGRRTTEMKDRIVEMATLRVEQRVAHTLLRLTNQAGRKVEEGIEIAFPLTRQDLSELTGTTLHTVSRLLSGWQKDGLVHSERKRITVRDPHALVVLTQA
jgi:CRP-like cAMP-binding protein